MRHLDVDTVIRLQPVTAEAVDWFQHLGLRHDMPTGDMLVCMTLCLGALLQAHDRLPDVAPMRGLVLGMLNDADLFPLWATDRGFPGGHHDG